MLVTTDGVPYLAPELQMLFKSTAIRPKDDLDAAPVIPRLDPGRRACVDQPSEWKGPGIFLHAMGVDQAEEVPKARRDEIAAAITAAL